MHDDQMDELLREARASYHAPASAEPPLERMWARIDAQAFDALARGAWRGGRARTVSWWMAGAGIAAALVLGVGIGRLSVGGERGGAGPGLAHGVGVPDERALALPVEAPYDRAATQYLGQTAALLSALPAEARHGGGDARFVAQAADLLTTTRLLLDSPAAGNPRVRSLLEDLELVLAQIARLPAHRDSTELDLIRKAVEQRDVVPRLHLVAADIAASDN